MKVSTNFLKTNFKAIYFLSWIVGFIIGIICPLSLVTLSEKFNAKDGFLSDDKWIWGFLIAIGISIIFIKFVFDLWIFVDRTIYTPQERINYRILSFYTFGISPSLCSAVFSILTVIGGSEANDISVGFRLFIIALVFLPITAIGILRAKRLVKKYIIEKMNGGIRDVKKRKNSVGS